MNMIFSGGVWILPGVCAAMIAWWMWRVVSAARTIGHAPVASVHALNLHDAAVGWIGRTVALVSYFVVGLVPEIWWPGWSSDAGWPLTLAGLMTVLGLILLELRWPAPGGTVRSAGLNRRRVRDVMPRAGTSIAGAGVLSGAGFIILCGRTAQPNAVSATPINPAFTWPGWSETAPYSIGLALLGGAAATAAVVLVRRPALAGMSAPIDIAYRRAAMDRVLRVVATLGFLVAAMVLNALKNVVMTHESAPALHGLGTVFAWLSVGLTVVAFVSIELFRAKLPMPAPPIPAASDLAGKQ